MKTKRPFKAYKLFILIGVFGFQSAAGQNTYLKIIAENPELTAFDFLIGKWINYEKAISNKDATVYGPPVITIAKASDGFSIIENWQIKNHDTLLFKAVLHRIYDGTSKTWILSYSDSDLNYQEWNGKNENNTWQFYRERYKDGKKIIVKQKWVRLSPTRVNQIIERSVDKGITWNTGSVIEYTRSK